MESDMVNGVQVKEPPGAKPGGRLSCGGVNVVLFTLVCVFSMAAWIDMFGLWVEVPIMVQVLPEAWKLPSYLTIIMKAGNVAPIIYALINKCCKGNTKLREIIFSYVIIVLGAISCLLMAFFWKRTAVINNVEHSVAFFVLASLLSVVDCTSAVVFLPFMARFPPVYMTAYCIGEGLSGLVPGIMGLIQGAGSEPMCVNVTVPVTNDSSSLDHNTTYRVEPVYKEPVFSVEIYMLFLFFMLLFSGAAFTMLNFMPLAQKRKKKPRNRDEDEQGGEELRDMSDDNYRKNDDYDNDDAISTVESDRMSLYYDEDQAEDGRKPVSCTQVPSTCHLVYLLMVNAWTCSIMYGIMPAMLTYASLPYSELTYSLCVRLSTLAIPLAAFLTMVHKRQPSWLITGLAVLASALCAYPMYLATQSPHPLLQHHAAGHALVVIVTVLGSALFSYSYTLNHVLIQTLYGHRGLLWCGATTQLGSLCGGVVIFVLVSVLNVFKAIPECA